MTKQKLSSKEIAQKLGISASTARGWAKRFDVPRQRKNGSSVYTQEALDALIRVKEMRSNGNGYNTIQRMMEASGNKENTVLSNENTPSQASRNTPLQDAKTELTEKYAKATFETGQLQEKVKNLEAQAKLLPSAVDWALKQKIAEDLQIKIEAQEKQLKEQAKRQRELEQLLRSVQDENQALKNRGLFARLFNLKR